MLQIIKGDIKIAEQVKAKLNADYKKKLDGMKVDIACAKQTLAGLKAHKKAAPKTGANNKESFDVLIDKQRDYIEKLEANYSNAYWGAKNYPLPVWVDANVGGSVLMDWEFLSAMLRKMKGMTISFSVVYDSKYNKALRLTYWNYGGVKGGTKGVMELNGLDEMLYDTFTNDIPVAAAEF